jgi:hypothetical protein
MTWQPIETAPMDEWILAWWNGCAIQQVRKDSFEGKPHTYWYDLYRHKSEPLTHWMPLPAPPKDATK